MSKPKSVKVRIAVAVDARGNFGICAVHRHVETVTEATTEALYDLRIFHDSDGPPAVYLVTVDAHLPPPPQTLPAKVTKIKEAKR